MFTQASLINIVEAAWLAKLMELALQNSWWWWGILVVSRGLRHILRMHGWWWWWMLPGHHSTISHWRGMWIISWHWHWVWLIQVERGHGLSVGMRNRRSYWSRHCGRSWGSRDLSCRGFQDFQCLICSEQWIAKGNLVILIATSLRYFSAFLMDILKKRHMIATAQLSFLALVSSKCSFPTLCSKQEMSGCMIHKPGGYILSSFATIPSPHHRV